MSQYKKPFEDYLSLIENILEYKLFNWQKEVLLQIYNGNYGCLHFGRCFGVTMLEAAAHIMCQEIHRDTINLPPRLYEPDGYAINVVTCDENWGENIEWEKENKI